MIFTRKQHLIAAFVCAVVALIAVVGLQSALAQTVPNGAAVITPETFVSLDHVPQGQTFEAAVVVKIASGFHMNSHKPSEDYLIPTTITATPPQGIRVVDTIYPPGHDKTFTFSPKQPLNVYSDSMTLVLKLAADAGAPVGATQVPAILRYQACNDTMCLPPVRVPVTVAVDVVAAGTASHHVHADVFAADGK
jgi:thioredoxin:protein disulfide reductase